MTSRPAFTFLATAALAALALCTGSHALAQAAIPQSTGAPVARPAGAPAVPATGLGLTPGATSFYQDLGGKAGIDAIVVEFVKVLMEDERFRAVFDGVDMDRLRVRLAEQFCVVSGGPCTYTGRSMAESHEDLKITNAQFNASVEHLQIAMERRGVPTRVQNRLLARLAPSQREIVTK